MIFIHKNSLSVNDASTQEDFYDVCGWFQSQPKQDRPELETAFSVWAEADVTAVHTLILSLPKHTHHLDSLFLF